MLTKFYGSIVITLLVLVSSISYGQQTYDLAIKNVKVFDSKTKKIQKNRTILINADTIASIVSASTRVKASKTINGNNRLVIPGFIDTHTHLRNVYGNLEDVEKDPLGLDRRKLSDVYLRYGTTTIIDMGQPEKWMSRSLDWEKNPEPGYPNIFISGGAMVTLDTGRKTYMNHVAVKNPDDARLKVQEYANRGLQHIKIYSRLRRPEMEAVIAEGIKRHLTISAHIDNNITSISDAIDLGVKNFEHVLALPSAVINLDSNRARMREKYGIGRVENSDQFLAQLLFFFAYIKENPELDTKLEALLDKMAKNKATLSTTIHIMGSIAGTTYFFTSLTLHADTLNLPGFTSAHKEKMKEFFPIMMKYLKDAYDKGVKLRIGTDCPDGGKALLSELLLLYEANFTIGDIIQIATLNGAQSMNIDDKYGSIEKGKKADLVIFSEDPFDNYRNFLSEKTIIKGGKIFGN